MIGIGAISGSLTEVSAGLLAVCLHKDESPPEELNEAVASILSNGDFSGKDGETALVYAPQGLTTPRLLLVGLGDRSSFTLDKLRRAAATAAKRAQTLKLDDAAFALHVTEGSAARVAAAEAAAEGAVLGAYRFDRHKTAARSSELETFNLISDDEDVAAAAQTGAKTAAATVLARDLANEPSNEATPEYLAGKAREIAERYSMQANIFDRAGIEDEGLNGLATVGRSAANEPRFIVLEHRKGGEEAPVVLVGKAVTFDSGGISIKPSGGMDEMKYDMSGGAAVLGAMEAVGALDLALNVIALVPATENLPAGNAFKPGDVLELHSGKTVEIVTTDAEGRLILADALSYAKRYEPAAVIDCATLTGACVVALGHHASGLMGNDEALIAEVQKAGEAAGERAWHLPLFDEYTEQTKGETADLKNSGGRPGGALTAGAFLKEFVDYPWVHLDIAGTAYGKSKNAYTPKGASGTPARLLVEFLRGRAGDRAVEVTR
ncbi:MAG: Cytosol aminopeptidase PepA [uncultured Rubrobacteraceae bacterium]|uniref:Probable cytosol aminopeptidase n=1 Tax=uncultured Rubrobacteraceae bacterium TaxID=349277 RepID=A0A6J4QRN3_9ACTN|nr:MAG: Cytosol aminopeptidase PepA [uncultured Rubrobacteraceae bacterium]